MLASWEKSVGGRFAKVHDRKAIASPNLNGLGLQKMTDVICVRASFQDQRVGFEPYLSIRLARGNHATSYALLLSEYPRTSQTNADLPTACVRGCHWDGLRAIRELQESKQKQDYAMETPSLTCEIRFFNPANTVIDDLMEQTAAELRVGVAFETVDRPEPEPEEIDFFFCNGLQSFRFLFSPRCSSSIGLENLCRQWNDNLSALVKQDGRRADDGCEIEYAESLWERINRYR